jgi:hypothetical protein
MVHNPLRSGNPPAPPPDLFEIAADADYTEASHRPIFHQRNPMPAKDVARGRAAAARQEDVVLAFFRVRPDQGFTPPEVLAGTGLKCPLTSIRRALTGLTRSGLLRKHVDDQRPGPFGMKNCTWSLEPGQKGR